MLLMLLIDCVWRMSYMKGQQSTKILRGRGGVATKKEPLYFCPVKNNMLTDLLRWGLVAF